MLLNGTKAKVSKGNLYVRLIHRVQTLVLISSFLCASCSIWEPETKGLKTPSPPVKSGTEKGLDLSDTPADKVSRLEMLKFGSQQKSVSDNVLAGNCSASTSSLKPSPSKKKTQVVDKVPHKESASKKMSGCDPRFFQNKKTKYKGKKKSAKTVDIRHGLKKEASAKTHEHSEAMPKPKEPVKKITKKTSKKIPKIKPSTDPRPSLPAKKKPANERLI